MAQIEIVVIKHGGRTYRGPVSSKQNWGPSRHTGEGPSDWYVEFTHDAKSAGKTGDPGYVKQVQDGVTSLEFVMEDA